jgi:6-pyruvoyltetrahydropterin/6-carboxytetrahydropterin synthase
MITATKFHDFSTGHRVYGHENKCAHLHGHNYRIHFSVGADGLDSVGRILDFGAIGNLLCNWLEENWDHKFLVYTADPWANQLLMIDPDGTVLFDQNPTAENMADYLVNVIGPQQLAGTGCKLVKVIIEETRKCSVTLTKD